ncbi:MAG: 23S rRNA (pseudouridine(1915)-N(3))-methyltransferase RlmH [Coriobacteriia bacterium]|nr:23S rRNA (pseudouridine(1915)-N(3))-methyltransferase RlmH [Coriobacteriia bacterium]
MGLRVELLSVGKLKEGYWLEAAAEYRKRLQGYIDFKEFEVSDRPSRAASDAEAVRRAEGKDIIAHLQAARPGSSVILLDRLGRPLSSEGLAERLQRQEGSGTPELTFIIGGSFGVSPEVKAAAHEAYSFGALTLPHNLARIVLMEQLYRACRINRGEPYHK